jgi:hypothetical protein
MTEPEKYQALYNKISELYQLENTPTQDPLPKISVLAQNNQDIMPLLISDLSEQIWCAGWLVDCEFELWNRVQQYKKYGCSSPWGLASSEAIQKDIEILSTASDLTQKWALWKEEGPESIDLTSWEKIFQTSASNELKNITQPICGELGKLIEDKNWPRIQSCHLPAAHSQTHNFT